MPMTIDRSELPEHNTIAHSLDKLLPFRHHSIVAKHADPLLKLSIRDLNLESLVNDTIASMEKFGSWNYRLGMKENSVLHDAGYGGIGLTYNPTHRELENSNIHEQVQGNPKPAQGMKNPFSSLTADKTRQYATRNSHYDTYGLSYRTPASRYGYLGSFLDRCTRTMVRSAVRIIYAENEGPVGEDRYAGVTWHRDEPMFENLRVNIPLVTDPIFVLEQQGHEPVHLEAGYAYSWDTNVLHRAYATKKEPKHRIHLMLGFSCWWDFDEQLGTWTQNEFFGKIHPKDMLANGLVINGVSLN
jgi:hypothetical protein